MTEDQAWDEFRKAIRKRDEETAKAALEAWQLHSTEVEHWRSIIERLRNIKSKNWHKYRPPGEQ